VTLRAMDNGVSGLLTEQGAIGVAGDNIANSNTPGFKRERSVFEDVLIRSSAGQGQGAGVEQGSLQQAFTQGSLEQTGVSTDLGISGNGFFAVTGSVNGVTGTFYSRAGEFRLDSSGNLVDPTGMKLLGYATQSDGSLAASVTPLVVSTSSIPAKVTDSMQLAANLDASAAVPSAPFSTDTPTQTANFSTSIQVFDTLGGAHSVDVYFAKTAAGQWEYHALANGNETTPASPGNNVEIGSGSLTFTSRGELDSLSTTQAIQVTFGAADPQTISINLGSPLSTNGTGLDGITQFASPSNVSSESQNGYTAGAMSGVTVDSNGQVAGLYTNGLQLPVGQVVMAKFRSENGLARAGSGLWVATPESGQPALGTANSGGRGAISSGTLESSNVSLAQEFTDIITHQRSFSANSKVIAAADDMLTQLMQLHK
jgi:flagellar hook protein FlgE